MTEPSRWSVFGQQPYRNIFVALIAIVLIDALAPNFVARGRFADLMVAALLLAALVETVRSRHNGVWALALGLPAIAGRVIAAFRPDTTAQNTTVLGLSILFFAFLIWNLLHDLNTGGRSTSERIFGALCAYVFIGLLFALIFAHLEYRDPGSFYISNDLLAERAANESSQLNVFTYFSFVTMTTLGYGDVTPVEEHARTLVWLEALIGQLYLAVMVAGFVAVHISERMRKNRGDPPPDGPGRSSS
jgi:hypothetical protein